MSSDRAPAHNYDVVSIVLTSVDIQVPMTCASKLSNDPGILFPGILVPILCGGHFAQPYGTVCATALVFNVAGQSHLSTSDK